MTSVQSLHYQERQSGPMQETKIDEQSNVEPIITNVAMDVAKEDFCECTIGNYNT